MSYVYLKFVLSSFIIVYATHRIGLQATAGAALRGEVHGAPAERHEAGERGNGGQVPARPPPSPRPTRLRQRSLHAVAHQALL